MKKSKFLATFLILLLCLAAVAAGRFLSKSKAKAYFDKRVSSRAVGSPEAPIWITEYTDFQCEACREAAWVVKRYLTEYSHDIFFQVRYHPLIKSHPFALKSAIYAECAARQGKFWEYYDVLFEKQPFWSSAADPDNFFLNYAANLKLNTKRLSACVENPETKDKIIAEKDEGLSIGVVRTPTFFVNGEMLTETEALDEKLRKIFSLRKNRQNR